MVMMMMTEMMKHHLLGLLVMSATTVCPLGGVSEMRNGAGRNFAPRVHWFRIGRPVFFNIQRYMYLIVTFLFLFAYGFSVAVWFFWFCGGRESCEQAWFSDGQASCLLMKDIRKFYFLSNCWFSLLIYIYIFPFGFDLFFSANFFFLFHTSVLPTLEITRGKKSTCIKRTRRPDKIYYKIWCKKKKFDRIVYMIFRVVSTGFVFILCKLDANLDSGHWQIHYPLMPLKWSTILQSVLSFWSRLISPPSPRTNTHSVLYIFFALFCF